MIINRRTSFTDLEYPNPFEDPAWSSWDAIPNKEQVSVANPGQKVTYVVPDGAEGWYAMRVVPDGLDRVGKRYGSWGYAYLHEGTSVELWCNTGSTGPGRKSLGADGVALGGAAGVLCGFKKLENISGANYGTYPTANPIRVVSTSTLFTPWEITFSDGKKITRYTLGTEEWDATSSKNSALFILIDGKPCLSFEDPSSIMAANGAIKIKGAAETFDGVYLGTVPVEMNKSIFTVAAGLICGQSATNNDGGGGALGSSATREGPTSAFGSNSIDSTDGHGGSAFFDFTRGLAESNVRRFVDTTTVIPNSGAWLYKITETGHDYSQPYGQIFTAPDTHVDATFAFYINEVVYTFPSWWHEPNIQRAGAPYSVYIPGVHIGDIFRVAVTYADGTFRNAIYVITMHDIVYGLTLKSSDYYYNTSGQYTVALAPGFYEIKAIGGGGAGGGGGSWTPSDYNSGAGGGGGSSGGITLLKDANNNNIIYCDGGIGGGGGGAEAGHGTSGGGGNGGGGLAGQYKETSFYVSEVTFLTAQVGDGGYGGKTSTDSWHHTAAGGIKAVYGLYSGGRGGYGRTNQTSSNCGGGGGGGGGGYNNQNGGAGGQGAGPNTNDGLGDNSTNGGNGAGGGGGASTVLVSLVRVIGAGMGGPGGGNGNVASSNRGGGGGGGNFAFGGATDIGRAGNGINPNQSGQAGTLILNKVSGSGGNGGLGGIRSGGYRVATDGSRGTDGAIYIKQTGTVEPVTEVLDLGYVLTADPSLTDDAGAITGAISTTDDAGAINTPVEETDDAGGIYSTIVPDVWNLGDVDSSVTEEKDLGIIIRTIL